MMSSHRITRSVVKTLVLNADVEFFAERQVVNGRRPQMLAVIVLPLVPVIIVARTSVRRNKIAVRRDVDGKRF